MKISILTTLAALLVSTSALAQVTEPVTLFVPSNDPIAGAFNVLTGLFIELDVNGHFITAELSNYEPMSCEGSYTIQDKKLTLEVQTCGSVGQTVDSLGQTQIIVDPASRQAAQGKVTQFLIFETIKLPVSPKNSIEDRLVSIGVTSDNGTNERPGVVRIFTGRIFETHELIQKTLN